MPAAGCSLPSSKPSRYSETSIHAQTAMAVCSIPALMLQMRSSIGIIGPPVLTVFNSNHWERLPICPHLFASGPFAELFRKTSEKDIWSNNIQPRLRTRNRHRQNRLLSHRFTTMFPNPQYGRGHLQRLEGSDGLCRKPFALPKRKVRNHFPLVGIAAHLHRRIQSYGQARLHVRYRIILDHNCRRFHSRVVCHPRRPHPTGLFQFPDLCRETLPHHLAIGIDDMRLTMVVRLLRHRRSAANHRR
jgi:hypothetical protein